MRTIDDKAARLIQQALNTIPAECRYHGKRLNRDPTEYLSGPCCDTGRPSLARRYAERALEKAQGCICTRFTDIDDSGADPAVPDLACPGHKPQCPHDCCDPNAQEGVPASDEPCEHPDCPCVSMPAFRHPDCPRAEVSEAVRSPQEATFPQEALDAAALRMTEVAGIYYIPQTSDDPAYDRLALAALEGALPYLRNITKGNTP